MRTTVTLDPDTENLLREAVRRNKRSFKQVLNEAVRRGLRAPNSSRVRVEPIFNHPFPAELEGVNFNHLADEIDDEDTLRELHR